MTYRRFFDSLAPLVVVGTLSCKQYDVRSASESSHPAHRSAVAAQRAVDATPAQVTRNDPPPDTSPQEGSTKELAQKFVEKTAHFQKLLEEHPHLGLMLDGSDEPAPGAMQFDFRAYGEHPGGETFTFARYRVDFKQKKVLLYDPVTSDYQELPGSTSLFMGADRK